MDMIENNTPRLFFISESQSKHLSKESKEELRHILFEFTNDSYEETFTLSGFPKDDGERDFLPYECTDKLAFFIDRFFEILGDSRRWINEAVQPDIFLKHISIYRMHLIKLQRLEPYNNFSNPTPTELLEEFKKNVNILEIAFLDRAYNSALLASKKLKTQEARQKRISIFFDNLELYKQEFSQSAHDRIKQLSKQQIVLENIISTQKNIAVDQSREKALLLQYRSQTNATKKHFARVALIDFYYKYRADSHSLNKCIQLCNEDIQALDKIDRETIEEAKKSYNSAIKMLGERAAKARYGQLLNGFIGRISAFDKLFMIYKSLKQYDNALDCCNHAIKRYSRVGRNKEEIDKFNKRISDITKLKQR